MKLSKRTLLKLKNKNKKLTPNKYKKLKRECLRGNTKGTFQRPRLSVYRSNQHIYAQIIDDTNSTTLLTLSVIVALNDSEKSPPSSPLWSTLALLII